MPIKIIANRIAPAGDNSVRSVMDKGTTKQTEGRMTTQHKEADNTRVESFKLKQEVLNTMPGGSKSEFLEGAVYSLSLEMYPDNASAPLVGLHQGLTLGEVRNISSYITMSEGSTTSFFEDCTAHSLLNPFDSSYSQVPQGTIAFSDIMEIVAKTDFFPELQQVVPKGSGVCVFPKWIKDTWLDDNLPQMSNTLTPTMVDVLC